MAAMAIAAIVTLPMLYLLIRAASAGLPAWNRIVFAPQTAGLLRGTAILAGCVALTSIAIALPFAWIVTRTDLPARRFWAVTGALPLVFPSYIAALAVVGVFGPRGEIALLLGRSLPPWIYGLPGAVISLALFSYPYLYLLLVSALRGMDPAIEESARSLGRTPPQVFFEVILPQLRAPLAAGSLLVVLYTISDFGAISIVGYDTFTTAIYDAYRGLFDRTVAAMLAIVLVVVTLLVLLAERLLAGTPPPTVIRPARPPVRHSLERWKPPALLFVGSIGAISLAVPVFAIALWVVRGIRTGAFSLDPLLIWNSFGTSAAAALAAVLLSLPVAIWAVRGGSRIAMLAERLTFSGYALPGMVIALALVFFSIRTVPALYQTTALLVAAYVVRFLPEAVAATRASLSSVAPSFEEAARTLGSSRFTVLRRVTLPMIRPGLLAGGGLVFLTAMKELPATLILRPAGFETLATRVWAETGVASWSTAALPALLLLAVSALPVWVLVIRPIVGAQR